MIHVQHHFLNDKCFKWFLLLSLLIFLEVDLHTTLVQCLQTPDHVSFFTPLLLSEDTKLGDP